MDYLTIPLSCVLVGGPSVRVVPGLVASWGVGTVVGLGEPSALGFGQLVGGSQGGECTLATAPLGPLPSGQSLSWHCGGSGVPS